MAGFEQRSRGGRFKKGSREAKKGIRLSTTVSN